MAVVPLLEACLISAVVYDGKKAVVKDYVFLNLKYD